MIRKYLYTKLGAHTALTDLIGQKIYPVVAPQNQALPFVTISVNEAPGDENFTTLTRLDVDQVTINCWASTVLGTETIHNIIRELFETVNYETFETVRVQAIQFVKAVDEIEDASEYYYISATYNIRISR